MLHQSPESTTYAPTSSEVLGFSTLGQIKVAWREHGDLAFPISLAQQVGLVAVRLGFGCKYDDNNRHSYTDDNADLCAL